MEVKILDSILHGSLKPWKFDNSNTRRHTEIIKSAKATPPATYTELLSYLRAILTDYPTLQKVLRDETLNNNSPLQQHIFKIDLPRYINPITQFYYSIITTESLRVLNTFIQHTSTCSELLDLRYQVSKTLTNIRVLAQQTAIELKERQYTFIPDSQSDHIHYTLYTLKQTLIVLFFEIQELFASQLKDNTSEEFFYLHYLNEAYPEKSPLTPTTHYFEFHFRSIQATPEFSKSATLHLLAQIQLHQPADSKKLQAAFENLIFLFFQETDLGTQTIGKLTDPVTIKVILEEAKTALLQPINKLQFGQQRLEAVNKLLDELEYILPSTNNNLSIPQMLYKYFIEQKTIFTQRFTEKFPVITEEEDPEQKQKEGRQKLSFGFHGDHTKLKTVVRLLCNQVLLLNEEKNNADELVSVFLSKDLQPYSTKLYVGCETVQFRYIVDNFSSHFTNFTPKAIEDSGLFFTKKHKPFKAQNLYSNKIEEPKDYLTIDNIFKQLQ
jgi:hypothetical protein